MEDLECHLRNLLSMQVKKDELEGEMPGMGSLHMNSENRPQFTIAGRTFVSFGNQILPIAEKPPTQVAGVSGINAFGPMGAR